MRIAAASVSSVLMPLFAAGLQAQEKVDFTSQIAPILVERCIDCHGPKEQEGDLRLDAREFVFAEGEEDFWVIAPKDPGDSELHRRLGLPLDDDEIMPASGDPLSKEQQQLFRKWIEQGADWPKAGDEWIAEELKKQVLPKITFELPELDAEQQKVIEETVAKLRQQGVVVQRVAADTNALEANLSLLRDKADDSLLAMLQPLAPVIVWLNASRTAITDMGGGQLAKLTQLRRLNVANTGMTDAGFRQLLPLKELQHLNAYGTGLGDDGLAQLANLPKLGRLYAWQSKVTKAGVAAIKEHFAHVEVDLGDYVEQRLAAARKEIEEREQRNKPVNDKCPVTGSDVKPQHFSEFEGKRVAFCCPKCKAKFDKDPKAFAAKIGGGQAGEGQTGEGKSAEGKNTDGAPFNDKCPVSGQAVDGEHVVAFDGKQVAFCCGKCKAAFEKEPKKFAAKIVAKGK